MQPNAGRIAVIAASDHGQISTTAIHPLFDAAGKAGFEIGLKDRLDGAAFTATGGRSGEIRPLGPDADALARIAAWLMDQPEVGHVFSRGGGEGEGEIPGTLSLGLLGNGHDRQPELMFVLRSDLSVDGYGLPGQGIMTPGDVPLGGGMHGGINRHELNTVLIVSSGEGEGAVSTAPAGIIDIAPTVLGLLCEAPAGSMTGRDLTRPAREEPRARRHEAGAGAFRQVVDIVEQDGRRFILGGGE